MTALFLSDKNAGGSMTFNYIIRKSAHSVCINGKIPLKLDSGLFLYDVVWK